MSSHQKERDILIFVVHVDVDLPISSCTTKQDITTNAEDGQWLSNRHHAKQTVCAMQVWMDETSTDEYMHSSIMQEVVTHQSP